MEDLMEQQSQPVSMLVIYRVKKEKEDEFLPLLQKHWPTLNNLGLVTQQQPTFTRGMGKDGKLSYIETFQWKNRNAPAVAHQTPEVMQIWEPMGPMIEGLELIETSQIQ
jgi:hypothetical protein